jgi:hypothetical protein
VAGGVIGALIGRALAGGAVAERPVARWIGAAALLAALVAVAYPMPTNAGDDISATVAVEELTPAPERTIAATITMDPPDAADDAAFFNVTAWQGSEWTRQRVIIDRLEEVRPGVWRTTEPIPTHGEWKAIVRLHKGDTLAALPVFMPADPGIPATAVLADGTFTRPFVTDKEILQREFTGGPGWLSAVAYATLALVGIGWVALIAWGLGRLLGGPPRPRGTGAVRGRGVRTTLQPAGGAS